MVCDLTGFKLHSVTLSTLLIHGCVVFFFSLNVHLGAKDRSEIYEAFENIYPILKGFKKPL